MSNTSKGWGRKGSKFWMQMVACFPKLEEAFIKQIAEAENTDASQMELEWISPRADKRLEEYSLNSAGLKDVLKLPEGFWDTWKSDEKLAFWTARQPQWDGIAFCRNSGVLYLIEAKAHISETYTEIAVNENSDGSKASFELRCASLRHTRNFFAAGGEADGCEETWWGGKLVKKVRSDEKFYYQVGNRLAFLKFLSEKIRDMKLQLDEREYSVSGVKLVFLNFADDYTLRDGRNDRTMEASAEQWKEHYEQHVWPHMIGKSEAPDGVLVINCSVRDVLPGLYFRKDADKEDNLFFYKFGEPESSEDIDVPFCFKEVDGKMRCCMRDTETVIPELERCLGVK